MIKQWALAIQKHEGYFPGSRSYRNCNPGNIRFTSYSSSLGANKGKDDKNFVIYNSYEIGLNALMQFLIDAATDELRAYRSDMTLYQFYSVYAPSTDGNYPKGYAEAVAKDLGVSANTIIKKLLDNPVTPTTMGFHRFGHADQIFVSVGDKVKKGQKLGTVGDGNGNYPNAAHVHNDRPKKPLKNWWDFTFGMTKEEVRNAYNDSRDTDHLVLPNLHHFGWRYLDYATYGTKKCYHPGSDLNAPGAGSADKGQPFFSPCDGVVVYCYKENGKNHGWGKLLVVEETAPKVESNVPENTEPTPVIITGQPEPTEPVPVSVTHTPPTEATGVATTTEEPLKVDTSWLDRFIQVLRNFFSK